MKGLVIAALLSLLAIGGGVAMGQANVEWSDRALAADRCASLVYTYDQYLCARLDRAAADHANSAGERQRARALRRDLLAAEGDVERIDLENRIELFLGSLGWIWDEDGDRPRVLDDVCDGGGA